MRQIVATFITFSVILLAAWDSREAFSAKAIFTKLGRTPGFALGVGVAGVLILLILRKIRKLPLQSPTEAPARTRRLAFHLFFALCSVFIVGRAIGQINTDLQWDEYNIACALYEGTLREVINPFLSGHRYHANTNQLTANITSFWSIHLFGLNAFGLRAPSIFFTAVACILMWFLGARFLSPGTAYLMGLHLVTNQTFAWYFHSAKGYISLFAASLGFYILTLRATDPSVPQLQARWLFIAGATLLLSHTFGGFFFAIAVLVFIISLWRLGSRPSGASSFIRGSLPLFPLTAGMALSHFLILGEERRELFQPTFSLASLKIAVAEAMGWDSASGSRFFLPGLILFFLLVTGLNVTNRDKLPRAILLFPLVSFAFIACLIFGLQVGFVRGKWLMLFVIPFLVWSSETVFSMRSAHWRVLLVGVLWGFFFLLPAVDSRSVARLHPSVLSDYHRFIDQVRLVVGDGQADCFTLSGDGFHQERWTRMFYFPGARGNPKHCKASYHIDFGGDLFKVSPRFLPADHPELSLILSDGKHRSLYRYPSQQVL